MPKTKHTLSLEQIEDFKISNTIASSTENGGKYLEIESKLSDGIVVSVFRVGKNNSNIAFVTSILHRAIKEYNSL